MPTVAELTERAKSLNLTGYSKLKKNQLEELIVEEERRRENEQLRKIREADAPTKLAPNPLTGFNPSIPLDVETVEILAQREKASRGLGVSNRIRIGHYLTAQIGRKKLTPAMARRMRKHYNKGDQSVTSLALTHNINVLPYL